LAWRLLTEYLGGLIRPTTTGQGHMSSRRIFEPQIPESVTDACDGVRSLVERGAAASLEELQGAVEYLLTKVMEARGLDGSAIATRLN